jgi:serine/threonine-protein kinase
LDIKPSNILIDKKNNARLIDFGVSKRYDIEQQETSTTMLTLSKGFAPIEQYDNEGTQSFSPCPDIYSLGATMYNLLTGEVPVESILRATKPLVKPSEINKDITPQTETAVLTSMQVNPIHRYQTVKALINELDIPSYFEDTPNLLIENIDFHPKIDKEETELRPDLKPSQPVDDEQTAIRQSQETPNPHIRRKKNKRRVLIPLLIFVFAFVGYGVVYLFELNGSRGEIQHIADVDAEPEEFSFPISEENTEPQESIPVVDNTNNSLPVETTRPETTPRTLPENQEPAPVENANVVSPEEIESEYNSLIESGKAKMNQKNYTEAKADFEKAQNFQVTSEVVSLINDCVVETKKALYEEKSSFGNLRIVRKKLNNMWGAIDNKGDEIIPCIYLSSSIAGTNRAFEREDHKYDLFNSNGGSMGSGHDNY